jgi:hypothetical protein
MLTYKNYYYYYYYVKNELNNNNNNNNNEINFKHKRFKWNFELDNDLLH